MCVVYSLLRHAELPPEATHPALFWGRGGPAAAFKDTPSSVLFRRLNLPVFKSRHPFDPSKAFVCSCMQKEEEKTGTFNLIFFSLPKGETSSLRHSREGAGSLRMQTCLSPSLPSYKCSGIWQGQERNWNLYWNLGLLYKLLVFVGCLASPWPFSNPLWF